MGILREYVKRWGLEGREEVFGKIVKSQLELEDYAERNGVPKLHELVNELGEGIAAYVSPWDMDQDTLIQFWNKMFDELREKYAGKVVMLAVKRPQYGAITPGPARRVFSSDNRKELETIATQMGYKYPFIMYVPPLGEIK